MRWFDETVSVSGIALDSRAVKPGDVFFAVKGLTVDGNDFVASAVEAGAVGVIADRPHGPLPVPQVHRPNLARELSQFASEFYGEPSKKLYVVGVTGTNGKSSVVDLLAQAWRAQGKSAAAMGTLGVYGAKRWRAPGMTTDNPFEVQRNLALLVAEGVTHVAMEVSSHALDQGRVEAVDFDQGVFTNLSRDHLDYHGTMEAYGAAKQRLFTQLRPRDWVLNGDTDAAVALLSQMPAGRTYGLESDVSIASEELTPQGSRFDVNYADRTATAEIKLLGGYNRSNALAVVACLLGQGVALPAAVELLGTLQPVPGRMQLALASPKVLVDYAHTPDGLRAALAAARPHTTGQLWVVFGAGGDRDAGKRPLMGQAAEDGADQVVLTSDNPRSEDPEKILDDIQAGMRAEPAARWVDRRQAIAWTLDQLQPNDVLIVAGKGHETEQVLADRVIEHDDVRVVQEVAHAV